MTTPDFDRSSFGPERPEWRRVNRALLTECGVPHTVADSDRNWLYVLLHGDDYPGTGWDTSWISTAQADTLLHRLQAELADECGFELVRCLRGRLSSRDR